MEEEPVREPRDRGNRDIRRDEPMPPPRDRGNRDIRRDEPPRDFRRDRDDRMGFSGRDRDDRFGRDRDDRFGREREDRFGRDREDRDRDSRFGSRDERGNFGNRDDRYICCFLSTFKFKVIPEQDVSYIIASQVFHRFTIIQHHLL